MVPNGVLREQLDVYSNDSPGSSVGCCPTTPRPLTSSRLLSASVMIQCRLINRTLSERSFVISIV